MQSWGLTRLKSFEQANRLESPTQFLCYSLEAEFLPFLVGEGPQFLLFKAFHKLDLSHACTHTHIISNLLY